MKTIKKQHNPATVFLFGAVLDRCSEIDLMQYGIERDTLRVAGFVSSTDYPELVLPNYFSAFVHRNVRIEIAYKRPAAVSGRKVRFFRADSDEDRPNDPVSARPRPYFQS